MDRRKFIFSSFAASGALIVGGGVWLSLPAVREELTISFLLEKLGLLKNSPLQFSGDWNAFQIFNHMAQSVEFSMTGYPQHKSELFKSVIGKSAFSLFAQKGKMIHNLSEVIPGAAKLAETGSPQQALERLIIALEVFSQYRQPLQPHFAYGELNYDQYSLAHVMHVYDHLSELEA